MFKFGLALAMLRQACRQLFIDCCTLIAQLVSIITLTVSIVSGRAHCNISIDTIIYLTLGSALCVCMLCFIMSEVPASNFILSIPVGIFMGLAFCFSYYKNLHLKVESAEMVGA
jgi:hypothetical protein